MVNEASKAVAVAMEDMKAVTVGIMAEAKDTFDLLVKPASLKIKHSKKTKCHP